MALTIVLRNVFGKKKTIFVFVLNEPISEIFSMPLIVVTRNPSPEIGHCELTCIERVPIDISRVMKQHTAYVEYIKKAVGAENVVALPALPNYPDCMFVEDVALVTQECAVLTRPGAASRQGEVDHIKETLVQIFGGSRVVQIEPPGTIDGGDVLIVGKNVFAGQSTRTNIDGFSQLAKFLEPLGYYCKQIQIPQGSTGCMHLKCAVTKLNEDTVLVNPSLLDTSAQQAFILRGLKVIETEGTDANVLSFITGEMRHVVVGKAFPKTLETVQAWAKGQNNVIVSSLEVDEVAKAEGALTCCSLLCYVP